MRSEGARGSEDGVGAVEQVVGGSMRSEGAHADAYHLFHGAALSAVAAKQL